MRDYQPNPELMLDSKTHSRAGIHGTAALRNDISWHLSAAAQKSRHSALDFSHSNPDFCHPSSREKIAMHMAHLISKNGVKTAAGRLWTVTLMDAAIGGLLCALAAVGFSAAADGHAWKNLAPLIFTAVLLLTAAVFGARAGILGTVLAAMVFAGFLFGPVGSIHVANESARANLGWMLLIGIGFSFLFAPPTSTIRRH
jgi:K+-sensing histidine kinase KdpD